MPSFGNRSKENLVTAHEDLQKVANEVIKYFDCTVTSGHRTPEEQFELFKKGRKESNGEWVIVNKREVVTHVDGYDKKSKHNEFPSKAIDLYPCPVSFNKDERDRAVYFAGYFIATARQMYERGEILQEIFSGMDWDGDNNLKEHSFVDIPHMQIK